MAQRTYPKADLRYWTENVFRRRRTVDGSTVEAGEFSARIQHGGRRQFFNLGTSNKAQAGAVARDIYTYLRANGWEQTLAKYKAQDQPVQVTNADATIGEFLAQLRTKANLKPKTLEGYAVALRKIVSDIFGFPHGTGGDRAKREAWRRKVHAVKIADLTPAKVQAWKLAFVARAGDDPAKQRTARISANSFLRRAKSLFAPEVTRHLEGITLPDPLPFRGVDFYQRPSMRYRSGFDLSKLVEDARNELAEAKPEQFKAFVLAVMAGLRRREIDTLEWSAFRWKAATIRIEPTRYFQPKTEDSIGDVEVDTEVIEIFRDFRVRAKGTFVIESAVAPRPGATWEHYRCDAIFKGLIRWLRRKGITASNPLHSLRKEFGSQVAARHGIYAASRLLRHADIQTTAGHYLDKKQRITAGLGGLLKASNGVPLNRAETATGSEPGEALAD